MKWYDAIKFSMESYKIKPSWPFDDTKSSSCTFINHYSLLILKDRSISVADFDYIFLDGYSLSKQLSSKLKLKIDRISFDLTSVAESWFKSAVSMGANIIIVGGTSREIKIFEEWWRAKFTTGSNPVDVNFIDGYSDELHQKIINLTLTNKFNFVLLGLGTPLQENLSLGISGEYLEKKIRGITLTCGGFITQTAKSITNDGVFYPSWIDKFNLRWLYRCYKQPFVIKRLILKYPVSFINVAFDKIR